MNQSQLIKELRFHLQNIISMDPKLQRESIELIYDQGAHLESPYMVSNLIGSEWTQRNHQIIRNSHEQ